LEPPNPTAQAPQNHLAMDFGLTNETVFALGILLIELGLRKPFAQLITPADIVLCPDGSRHAITNFKAAKRLSNDLYQEATELYADAVRRCISGNFDVREHDLHNSAYCEEVYRGVVVALERDVESFTRKT